MLSDRAVTLQGALTAVLFALPVFICNSCTGVHELNSTFECYGFKNASKKTMGSQSCVFETFLLAVHKTWSILTFLFISAER